MKSGNASYRASTDTMRNPSYGTAGTWRSGDAQNSRRTDWNRQNNVTRAYDIDVDVYPQQGRSFARQAPAGYYEYSRATVVEGNQVMTEEELIGLLHPQARAEYFSLSPQAKALALQLASQPQFQDKLQAVREAKMRTNGNR
jgi:hypothetical protein